MSAVDAERSWEPWIWSAAGLMLVIEFLIIMPTCPKCFWRIVRSPSGFVSQVDATANELCQNCQMPSQDDQVRSQNFRLKIWLLASLVGSALAGAIAAFAIQRIVDLWRTGVREARLTRVVVIVGKSVLFGGALGVFLPPPPRWHMGTFGDRIRLGESGLPFYMAIGAVMVALWAIEFRVSTLSSEHVGGDEIRQFVWLRACAQSLFSMASIILVCGVLHVGARQELVRVLDKRNLIGPGSLIFEGLLYTLLLAFAYIPIHARFNSVGQRILDRVMQPVRLEGAVELQNWAKIKADTESLLQLRSYEWKAFGPGLAVMAPFVTGLLSKAAERVF